jgi:hypothetical protein
MHQKQIEILNTKVLQRLVEGCFYIFWCMLGIPKLAGKEDLGASNSTSPYAVTHFGFIAVDGSAIDVAIACLECCLYGALDFSRLCLPCAEAHGRYLRACVEGEVCGNGHVC